MEKKQYEGIKELKLKVLDGTANFHERNILKIIERKKAKGKKIYFGTRNG